MDSFLPTFIMPKAKGLAKSIVPYNYDVFNHMSGLCCKRDPSSLLSPFTLCTGGQVSREVYMESSWDNVGDRQLARPCFKVTRLFEAKFRAFVKSIRQVFLFRRFCERISGASGASVLRFCGVVEMATFWCTNSISVACLPPEKNCGLGLFVGHVHSRVKSRAVEMSIKTVPGLS